MSEGFYYTWSDSDTPEVVTKPEGYKSIHGTGYQKTVPQYFFYLNDLESNKDKTIKIDVKHQSSQTTPIQNSSCGCSKS